MLKLEQKEIIPALGNNQLFDLEEYMMVIFDRFKKKQYCREIIDVRFIFGFI